MATSKVMASSTTTQTSDIRRKISSAASPSSSSSNLPAFFHNQAKKQADEGNPDSNLITLDRFLENVYADDEAAAAATAPVVSKTVDDVWREIVEGKRAQFKEEAMDEMMTLEDFLVMAGAVDDDDDEPAGEVKIEPDSDRFSGGGGGSFRFDMGSRQHSMDEVVGFGNAMEAGGGAGRGKRRAILEPLDKAAMQRQRRMIKNRESAARSRERKQAYQVELESMAVKLEEENEQLLREKADRTKELYKQLMEKVIPVTERRRPPRALRRVNSMPL